jgi:hypothetical protein
MQELDQIRQYQDHILLQILDPRIIQMNVSSCQQNHDGQEERSLSQGLSVKYFTLLAPHTQVGKDAGDAKTNYLNTSSFGHSCGARIENKSPRRLFFTAYQTIHIPTL